MTRPAILSIALLLAGMLFVVPVVAMIDTSSKEIAARVDVGDGPKRNLVLRGQSRERETR